MDPNIFVRKQSFNYINALTFTFAMLIPGGKNISFIFTFLSGRMQTTPQNCFKVFYVWMPFLTPSMNDICQSLLNPEHFWSCAVIHQATNYRGSIYVFFAESNDSVFVAELFNYFLPSWRLLFGENILSLKNMVIKEGLTSTSLY